MSSPFECRGFLRLGLGALSAGAFDVLGIPEAIAKWRETFGV